MNSDPAPLRASILIVSFNSRADLPRCLAALECTIGADCEIVLLDNASADDSAAYVRVAYPAVKLIVSPTNIGFAAGLNRAAAAASGRYLVPLNPDTEVMPGWLDALLAPLEAASAGAGRAVGLTTPRILLSATPDRINTCGNSMHFTGITVCRGLGQQANAPAMARPAEVSAVSGACFAISRALWHELGGLDEIFFTYLEDTDLSLRARLAGYRCLYVPQAVVYHDYVARFTAQKFFYLERNRLLMLAKSLRGGTLLLLLPALLIVEALTWTFALKSGAGHIRAKLRAYGWLIAQHKLVLTRRRQVQALRRVGDLQLLSGMAANLDVSQLAGGAVGRAADLLLNPLFRLWHRLSLAIAR